MKKIFLLLSLCTLLFSSSVFKNDKKLLANNKGVVFVFETNSCVYCDILRKDFETNETLKILAKDFNIYSINQDEYKEYEMGSQKPVKITNTTSLKIAFSVKGSPNIVIFDKNWNKIFQLPGYVDASQMKVFLSFVNSLHKGTYKKDQWREYLKNNGVY